MIREQVSSTAKKIIKVLNNRGVIAFASILIASFSFSADTTTRVDKINYCRSGLFCNDKLQDDYHWWEEHGVPDQIQKQTYLSRYVEPAKPKVEHLVFIASGQRGPDSPFDTDDFSWNLLTGQGNFDEFGKKDSHKLLDIHTSSLAFRLFDRGVFSEENTFAGLAFDARFNWGFSKANKNDIVDAYFSWLTSKVYIANLKSVYLAGHSRGGALVLRLAEKFQRLYPDVVVVVHGFDPVPNINQDELHAYRARFDNPVAGFPADTDYFDNQGNWAWMTNFRSYFADKTNLSAHNMVIGGKIFGLAYGVRAVTNHSAREQDEHLGWYSQHWYSIPELGFSNNESAEGHTEIAKTFVTVNAALNHVQERRDAMLNNMASFADVTSSSSRCNTEVCFADFRINDEDFDTREGDSFAWASADNNGSEWVQLTWSWEIEVDAFEIFTSETFPIGEYRAEYLDESGLWLALAPSVTGNAELHIRHELATPIRTTAIRFVDLNGSIASPEEVRINEILVEGRWINQAPSAQCSASPLVAVGPSNITVSSHGSQDSDGTIEHYEWNVNGALYQGGSELSELFIHRRIVGYNQVQLVVTDNQGRRSEPATCGFTIYESGGRDPIFEEPIFEKPMR